MKRPRAGTLVLGTDRDSSKNYMPLAMALFDEGKSMGVQVLDVTVIHDDWCAMLKGLGYCDCSPVVVHGKPEDIKL